MRRFEPTPKLSNAGGNVEQERMKSFLASKAVSEQLVLRTKADTRFAVIAEGRQAPWGQQQTANVT